MRLFNGKIEGDASFIEDTKFSGMVTGSATVEPGVVLELCGVVSKDLRISPRAIVNLRGTVGGNVLNDGGTLEVFGMVDGRVEKRNGGSTTIHAKAIVAGVEH